MSYTAFHFKNYAFDADKGRIELEYDLKGSNKAHVHFTEVITLPKTYPSLTRTQQTLLDRALFALHLVGGISYYKTYLPPAIEIHSGQLNEKQAEFWKTLYTYGLGEFFYTNGIDPRERITFPVGTEELPQHVEYEVSGDHVLVPIGGGKDSIVTTEILKTAGIEPTLLRIGEGHPVIEKMQKLSKCPLITVARQVDATLFELNEKGALNGHIPITAFNSFLAVVVAILEGQKAVVFSNERSANVGSVEWHDMEINHQWSKGLDAERLLQDYVHTSITPELHVFSLLRPWSELQIAKYFSGLKPYFSCAISCNKNWRIHKKKPAEQWCNNCPKCAFVFALFSAMLDKKDVVRMMGKNLFAEKKLIPLYRELLGLKGIKPFECVGTIEEVLAAFLLIKEKGDHLDTPMMNIFDEEAVPTIVDEHLILKDALGTSPDHAIPPEYATILPPN